MKTLLLITIVFLSIGTGYGYTQQDLVREIQQASIDCITLPGDGGILSNGYVFLNQYCTSHDAVSITTKKKTLIIDVEGLRWRRFVGHLFSK